MDDMRDLVGAYVLGALDPDERDQFERYLAEHPEVRAEVEALSESLPAMAESVAAEPPPRLKASVLAAIEDVEQEAHGSVAGPGGSTGEVISLDSRRRRWGQLVGAIAAVLILVVGVMAGTGLFGEDRIERVLAAPDARTIELVGEGLAATFTYSFDEQAGVFATDALPAVSPDQTYQLWLIDEIGPVSAGIFTPAGAGSTNVLVTGEIAPGVLLGLTVEPEGGSEAPTGDVLLAEPIT